MQFELREIQKKLGITFIFVTHDQEEALAMSDEIFVLNEGKIQQSGSPVDIYDEPVNDFVARFIGDSNILSGRMIKDYEVEFVNHRFECADAGIKPGEKVEVVLRPEDLDITDIEHGKLRVVVESQLFLGDHFEIKAIDSDENEWLIHSTNPTKIGKEVVACWSAATSSPGRSRWSTRAAAPSGCAGAPPCAWTSRGRSWT